MLKSLILLLLSVMIFTSCGDNGVEEEKTYQIKYLYDYTSKNYFRIMNTSENIQKEDSYIIKQIKNKKLKIKIKNINNQTMESLNLFEYNTMYNSKNIKYSILPEITYLSGQEIIKLNILANYESNTYIISEIGNDQIFEPLTNYITEIYLY